MSIDDRSHATGAPTDPRSSRDTLFDGGGTMGAVMAARDWASTPLGPPQDWPAGLRSAVRILLTSRFAMWMGWGPELTFFYNDTYQRDTLRAKHPSALGQPASEVWAEIWDDIGPRIASVLQSGTATWDEDLLLFLERSGYPEETYHTFSYSPLSDDAGTVAGMLCVVTEETDRVLSERRMATLRELATDLAAAHGVKQVLEVVARRVRENQRDLPFTLTYLFDDGASTAALVASTGVEPGDAVAPRQVGPGAADTWPVVELAAGRTVLIDDLRSRFAQLPTGAWAEPPAQAVAVPLAQPGQDRPAGFVVAALNPFRHYDERYRGFVELLANQMTSGLANARAYEADRRRAEGLAELDRAKTEFFTGISHELRTPLTLIMGPVAELRASPTVNADAALRTEVDVLHRNGLRLGKLVNTLLDFSRLQAGRMQARFESIDLSAFTGELASVFRSAVERAGLEFVVDCPPAAQPVFVDRDMWEKVVLNLLSNALKFTFDGQIVVTVRHVGPAAVLTVADTGSGIPAEELPNLFERFHRVPRARARSREGSGIGLAMVRELVALHGGSIDAASTPGSGTSFTVALPLGRAHLPADQVPATAATAPAVRVSDAAEPYVAEALRWLPSAEPVEPAAADSVVVASDPLCGAPDGPAARVLVADDNADMRDYLSRLLAPRYRVTAAGDGRAALTAALADPPDIVVSDVMMPALDGMELLAALRADQRTARVPVLLLSARAGQEAAVEGLAAGADDYLVKPFTAVELLARVDGHVRLSRARARERERQRLLATIGAAMDRETTLEARRDALTRSLVAEGVADIVRLISFDGDAQVVAVAARAPESEVLLRELAPGWPVAQQSLATGQAVLAEVDEAYLTDNSTDPGDLERRRRLDMRSVVLVPLTARGRVAGLLSTARSGNSPPQTTDDLTLLVDIGERAATALDNAQLYEREQATSRRLALLHGATAALSAAATPVQVAQVAVAQFRTLLGAPAVGVWELHATSLESVALDGWTEVVAREWRSFPLEAPVAARDAVLRREPIWVQEATDWERDYPHVRELVAGYGYESVSVLPLLAGGNCLGVVIVGFARERVLDTTERATAVALAEQCAQAHQRASLLARESAARQAAEEFAAVVSALSGALTPAEVTAVVVGHTAELGAAATAVLLRNGDQLDVLTAPDTAGPAADRRLDLGAAHPIAYAVRTGNAVWHDTRDAPAWPDQHFSAAGVDLPAQVVLPLLLGGTVIGAIGLRFDEAAPVFTADQRAALVTIAGQCAQALDRARLQQAEHEVADILQRSLLPRRLPDLAGLSAAARYLPGATGSQTGGDWYDLLPLSPKCAALVVGDVVGQGPSAAAVMGQLRSALAGYLLEGHAPAAALELLDAFAARVPGAQGSTCACLTVDWEDGRLRWARAGHPPVLLVDAEGARFLSGGAGTVLGVTGRPPYQEASAEVAPGASVVLYTDGLVERRGEVIDEGLARLAGAAAGHAPAGPAQLVAALLAVAAPDLRAHDDIAVIAARLMPRPLRQRLPASPATLSRIRRVVQSWARTAGLPDEQLDDLQLALGEATANAVEHAYRNGTEAEPELEYGVRRCTDGGVAVNVRDFGSWRPPPEDRGYRGRGVALIRRLAGDAVIEPSGAGTTVHFTIAPPEPVADAEPARTEHRPLAGHPGAAEVRAAAGRTEVALHGDIDPPAAATLRPALLAHMDRLSSTDGRPVLVLNLGAVSYLASAGVGLLLELADHARACAVALHVHAPPDCVASRVLALTGLADRFTEDR